jgi:peptide deformylase
MKIIEFGDPILRQTAEQVKLSDIKSEEIQKLIKDLIQACDEHPFGVGIAAPQIGVSRAVFVIRTKPTKSRPELKIRTRVVINPEILEYIGEPIQLWDGCLSEGKETMFAQTERYKKVRVKYIAEDAKLKEEVLDGFMAHVFQHETDHLSGILFVDRITNSKSWMSHKEYVKMRAEQK